MPLTLHKEFCLAITKSENGCNDVHYFCQCESHFLKHNECLCKALTNSNLLILIIPFG